MMRAWVLAVLGVVLAAGCAPRTVLIELSGPADLNRKLPFHLLVRNADTRRFRSDSYAEAARLVAQADATVLQTEVLYTTGGQGLQRKLMILPPKEGGLGLYFLFTAPSGSWRLLFERPLPAKIKVQLGGSSIQHTEASGKLRGPAGMPKLPEAKAPELPEAKLPEAPAAPKLPEAPAAPKAPELPAAPKLPGG
ncbi:MAG TPA: hypothetical protein PLW65_01430 [Pseudomonadota bacterium]|nr:hypothetical protein [Pseudomonadota bacterium]